MPIFSSTIQDHVANTMPAPYYKTDASDDYWSMSNPKIGDNSSPFSIECYFKSFDNPGSWAGSIFHSMDNTNQDAANDGIHLGVFGTSNGGNAGTWRLSLGEGATRDSNYDYNYNMATNKLQHVVFTCAGPSGAIKYYLDGVYQATIGTAPAAYIDTQSTARIGYQGGFGALEMEMYKLKLYNNALTAAEVKELYSGASVPFKYKGANQTDIHTSSNAITYGSETDSTSGWTDHQDSGDASVLTSESGGDDHNSTYGFKFITYAGGSATQNGRAYWTSSALTIGKRYRVTLDVKYESGYGWYFGAGSSTYASNQKFFEGATITDATSWTTLTTEFTATGAWTKIAMVDPSGGGGVIYFDNFNLVPIGAVAEYDGSGMGEKIWGDKSGNDLHGTVSGATLENTPYDSGTEYEEGYWSPTVGDGSNNFALAAGSDLGYYVRTGNLVHCQGYITISSDPGVSGNIRMSLPFTAATLNEDADYVFSYLYISNHGGTTTGKTHLFIQAGAAAYFHLVNDAGIASYISEGEVDTQFEIGFDLSYVAV